MFDVVFAAMLGAFFTHELDAMKKHEWRILPVLRSFSESTGEALFLWLHVPLFAVLILLLTAEPENVGRLALAAFAVVHVGLHFLFRKHPANEFTTVSSWSLILLTGFLGLAYLVLVLFSSV